MIPQTFPQGLPPSTESVRRRRGRPRGTPAPSRRLAAEVLRTMAALPTATPTPDDLADAMGRPAGELTPTLDWLADAELVERWPDPRRLGVVRLMLSAVAAARLGLTLAPTGDRWRPGKVPTGPGLPSSRWALIDRLMAILSPLDGTPGRPAA